MQALPIGVPKVLVSTMASGDVSPYVGSSDITMMYSVVDVAGINSVSTQIMGNAVAAAAGMAIHHERRLNESQPQGRPLIGASMFGVTTQAVDAARQRLDELGYEVLVFHATGAGGRALEKLAAGGFLAGVLDLTTTELADDLVGGVLSAYSTGSPRRAGPDCRRWSRPAHWTWSTSAPPKPSRSASPDASSWSTTRPSP